jgi:hypothetical protein
MNYIRVTVTTANQAIGNGKTAYIYWKGEIVPYHGPTHGRLYSYSGIYLKKEDYPQ